MLIPEALLKKLEEDQADFAKDALVRHQNRDAFEYGRVCGIYAGLEIAKSRLLALLDLQAEREREEI